MIVADTNVLSELMRPRPASAVVAWSRSVTGSDLFTTAVTVAEIRYGLARLPAGLRRDDLVATWEGLFETFEDRVLSFDVRAAHQYGVLVAEREAAGEPISMADAQIAAICTVHGAALATRNPGDFDGLNIELVDPWA